MSKAIVVLSDGTGNSAAKLAKTNVWRMYKALDLTEPADPGIPRQIAFYDDGVGTSSFRPLALLGGIFGWGLKNNVLDLYKFICRNYEDGDRIYAFGFSRGAFTIRILVGILAREGILHGLTEEELERHAPDAYRSFRKCFDRTKGLVAPLRRLRDKAIGLRQHLTPHCRTYAEIKRNGNLKPVKEIEFVGVWDTVAAYGMPLAELTRGIDNWVWPLSMPGYKLSPKVRKACHALALDDERDTFHPLLWDEVAEKKADRIEQVWFAGMHSDVGGGYPDDGLSYVSLDWMIDRVTKFESTNARDKQLRFHIEELEEIKRNRNELGPMHDSRRGLAGYYRYQPRRIDAMINPPALISEIMQDTDKHRGRLSSVKIHDSVFKRIEAGTDGYAPIVLPPSYEVVKSDPTVPVKVKRPPVAVTGRSSVGPDDGTREKRISKQEHVWDKVWWRRISYFITIGVSLMLAALPLAHRMWPSLSSDAGYFPRFMGPVITAVGSLLPNIFEPWIHAFAQMPHLFVLLVVIIAGLMSWNSSLQTQIQSSMHRAWEEDCKNWNDPVAGGTRNELARPTENRTVIYAMRSCTIYRKFFRWLKWWIIPDAFGLAVLWSGGMLAVLPIVYLIHHVGISDRASEAFEPAVLRSRDMLTLGPAGESIQQSLPTWLSDFFGRAVLRCGDMLAMLPVSDLNDADIHNWAIAGVGLAVLLGILWIRERVPLPWNGVKRR